MSNEALKWAWKQATSPTEKLVLVALADRASDNDMSCYPSLTRMQEDTGLNRTTVWRSIDKLVRLGLIERSGKRRGATLYRLKVGAQGTYQEGIKQVQGAPSSRCTEHLAVGAQDTYQAPTRCTEQHQVGAQCTSEPSVEPNTCTAPSRVRARESDDAPKQTAGAWVEFMVAHGFPPHVAQTVTTMAMYRGWVEGGITERQVSDAMAIAETKLEGRPDSPAYYRRFVESLALEEKRAKENPGGGAAPGSGKANNGRRITHDDDFDKRVYVGTPIEDIDWLS